MQKNVCITGATSGFGRASAERFATKVFINPLSRNLRIGLPRTKVRVTNIEPGLSESEFSIGHFHGDQGKAGSVHQSTQPLRPADIAEIVCRVTTAPLHVYICTVEVMPVCQSCGPLALHQES